MGAGGAILRFFNLAIRVLQFLASAVILGIFSYFLAKLAQNNQHIPTWTKAVEGLSGAATLYSLLGALFTCCLGGITFFAAVAIFLDVCFVGAMIAIAILTSDGTDNCSATPDTPVGTGPDGTNSPAGVDYGYACRLNKVVFAVSIISIFFFLISILFQYLLGRHHKREKRFGPSPANNYTYGTGTQRRGFWRRNKHTPENASADDMLPAHTTPGEVENGGVHNEKPGWFGRFGRRNEPMNGAGAPTAYGAQTQAPAAGAGAGGYGYGQPAYNTNY
ncbi:hypothetical protein ASPCAL06765 [Aspergillus calidoustus]|uniref:MARVEL domain-containing protein n=1 Tax=Aspergillus calidoustus TaxID=454130 RepID=A0A0U5G1P3_ASPCI|nr:hypothetical protein ASPCAL06765 [Aspergillus calidoustus]